MASTDNFSDDECIFTYCPGSEDEFDPCDDDTGSGKRKLNCKSDNKRSKKQKNNEPASSSKFFVKRFPTIAKEWNHKKNKGIDLNTVTYGSHKKVSWKCSKCNYEWPARIFDRSNGKGCPACASNSKIVTDRNRFSTLQPVVVKEWDDATISPYKVTVYSNKTVWWKCSKCNYRWPASIKNRSNGSGCPKCAPYSQIVTDRNGFSNLRPETAKEWDDETISLNEVTVYSNKTVWWKCSKCNYRWPASINNRSKGTGCPKCSPYSQIVTDRNRFSTLQPEVVKEWDDETISPDEVTVMSGKTVWWKCSKCAHRWPARIADRSNGRGCPKCAIELFGIGTSKTEQKIIVCAREQFGIPLTIDLQQKPSVSQTIVQNINETRKSGFQTGNIRPDIYLKPEEYESIIRPIFIEYDSHLHEDPTSFRRDIAKTDILLSIPDSIVFRIRDSIPSLDYDGPNKEKRYFELFYKCCSSNQQIVDAMTKIYNIACEIGAIKNEE